jgi:hypothetical protein
VPKPQLCDRSSLNAGWSASAIERKLPGRDLPPHPRAHAKEIDPLYLFACHLVWEQEEEPSRAWELLAAAQSSPVDTRAHARARIASSRHFGGLSQVGSSGPAKRKRTPAMETIMNAP